MSSSWLQGRRPRSACISSTVPPPISTSAYPVTASRQRIIGLVFIKAKISIAKRSTTGIWWVWATDYFTQNKSCRYAIRGLNIRWLWACGTAGAIDTTLSMFAFLYYRRGGLLYSNFSGWWCKYGNKVINVYYDFWFWATKNGRIWVMYGWAVDGGVINTAIKLSIFVLQPRELD